MQKLKCDFLRRRPPIPSGTLTAGAGLRHKVTNLGLNFKKEKILKIRNILPVKRKEYINRALLVEMKDQNCYKGSEKTSRYNGKTTSRALNIYLSIITLM